MYYTIYHHIKVQCEFTFARREIASFVALFSLSDKLIIAEIKKKLHFRISGFVGVKLGRQKLERERQTDGAGDEEARVGVLEKGRRGFVVEARDADYSRVLLPWCHLLFLTQLPLLLLLRSFFRHCTSSVLTSETDTQSLFEPPSTFHFLECMCALIPNNWTLFYVIVTIDFDVINEHNYIASGNKSLFFIINFQSKPVYTIARIHQKLICLLFF